MLLSKWVLGRRWLSSSTNPKLVFGLGSVVVDRFHHVRRIPKAGAKAYFASRHVVDSVVVGGVALNHLGWAAMLGVPTGLLSLQGDDEEGRFIRDNMKQIGMSDVAVTVSPDYASSVSLIFTDDTGERSIVMATAATSLIDANIVRTRFRPAVCENPGAAMITTEVSQVPLSGVRALIELSKQLGVVSCIDVDVPPSVAELEAKLGTAKEACEVACMADVVKPTLEAASELLVMMEPKGTPPVTNSDPLSAVALRLVNALGCKMAAVTDGHRGAGIAVKSTGLSLNIPCIPIPKVEDTTGAGDAFFGGMVAGIYHWGLPETAEQMQKIGQVAAALGAACVQQRGAFPHLTNSIPKIQESLPQFAKHLLRAPATAATTCNNNNNSNSSSSSSSIWAQRYAESFAADAHALKQMASVAAEIARGGSENQEAIQVGKVRKAISYARRVFTTGLGKSGIVASRCAASLSSVGIAAEYVHATEWLHGDLGKLDGAGPLAVVIAFSNSGNTRELLGLVEHFRARKIVLVAVTSVPTSPLGQASDFILRTHVDKDSEPLGLIPTVSVVAQEAVVNALLRSLEPISAADFRKNHPGGSIGAKLANK